MPISDFLYVSSYWVFYHALAENPNPIFQINPYTKKQLQLFGYYTMAFFMTFTIGCIEPGL